MRGKKAKALRRGATVGGQFNNPLYKQLKREHKQPSSTAHKAKKPGRLVLPANMTP